MAPVLHPPACLSLHGLTKKGGGGESCFPIQASGWLGSVLANCTWWCSGERLLVGPGVLSPTTLVPLPSPGGHTWASLMEEGWHVGHS